jgi:hypothetical protein
MKIRKLKFQVGDKVRNVRGRVGKITAIGQMIADEGKLIATVYRLGRNSYWHEWQLERVK